MRGLGADVPYLHQGRHRPAEREASGRRESWSPSFSHKRSSAALFPGAVTQQGPCVLPFPAHRLFRLRAARHLGSPWGVGWGAMGGRPYLVLNQSSSPFQPPLRALCTGVKAPRSLGTASGAHGPPPRSRSQTAAVGGRIGARFFLDVYSLYTRDTEDLDRVTGRGSLRCPYLSGDPRRK